MIHKPASSTTDQSTDIFSEINYNYIIRRNRRFPAGFGKLMLALACLLTALFLWSLQINQQQQKMAREIAPYVLRFHVIAASNSPKDQEVKLKVKSFLLEQIYQEMDNREGRANWGKAELIDYLEKSSERLASMAEELISSQGQSLPVSASIQWTKFPEKHYGDLDFPAGMYEAFQVMIGEGRGRNWWCVLYPQICMTKDAVQVTPESSRQKLKQLLSPENYQALTEQRPEIHINFALLHILDDLLTPESH